MFFTFLSFFYFAMCFDFNARISRYRFCIITNSLTDVFLRNWFSFIHVFIRLLPDTSSHLTATLFEAVSKYVKKKTIEFCLGPTFLKWLTREHIKLLDHDTCIYGVLFASIFFFSLVFPSISAYHRFAAVQACYLLLYLIYVDGP